MFPKGFPHAICHMLAMPLAWHEMLREDSTRYVYMLMAVGGELLELVQMMNLHLEGLIITTGGKLVAILIIEVEPEDFDFNGNHHDDMQN